MIAPSGTHHVTVDGGDLPAGTLPGDRVENEFTAENNGLITMLVVLENDPSGERVRPDSAGRSAGRVGDCDAVDDRSGIRRTRDGHGLGTPVLSSWFRPH